MQHTHPPGPSAGLTLMEACVTVAIGALLLSQAIPALQEFRQRQLWRATAEELGADLRLARAEAVRLSETVSFRVSGQGEAACYVLHTGPRLGCDCAGGRAHCTDGAAHVVKAFWLPPLSGMRFVSNVEALEFEASRGTATRAGSIELRLHDREAIRQVVAFTGRVRAVMP